VSATVPAVTGLNWCIASTAEPYGKRAWGGTDRIWSLGTSGANTASLDLASTFTVTDAAAGVKSVGTGSTPSTASHRIVACDKGGSLALSLDGAIASPGTGAGTGILGTASAAFYLGGASASLYGGVYLKSMRICSAGNAKACESARAPDSTTLASTFVAAYGDSLTGGELLTTPYPLLLGSLLGSTYAVTNKGVSGDTTSAINTRWGADNIRVNYLVLMGGINDIRVGTSAATTWTSLKATVDSAVARGVTVILGNVTPFNNYGGVYTVEKEAERQSLNSTIAAYCNGTTIRCVDVDALLRDPSDPTKLLPAYDYGDHIHHTQIAAAAMAAAFRAAIP
jgi:lysophospholipase L1-like esterase